MNHRTLKAFTLPELLISLSVIIILVTVLLPSLAGARQRAAKAAAVKTASSLRQKSEVLLTPTTSGSKANAKVYQADLCSVGFLEELQSINRRLSYVDYNAINDSFTRSTASNTEIGGDNKTTCHEKNDGTAWFVVTDINPKSTEIELYCTDYTGFAGSIQSNFLVDDYQCDQDADVLVYGLGSGFSQANSGIFCDPSKTDCSSTVCVDNPTTQWDECNKDCDNDGILNDVDPCDKCDADGSLGDVCGPSSHLAEFNWLVRTADMQSDGKYIVGGAFSKHKTGDVWKIARINVDGSLDTTFGSVGSGKGLKSSGEGHSSEPGTDAEPFYTQGGGKGTAGINILSTGKVLVLGAGMDADATTYNGASISGKGLIMLNSNGSLDTAFMNNVGPGLICGLDNGPCGTASSVEIGDKIWVAGRLKKWGDRTRTSGQDIRSGIVILNNDGTMASQQISEDDINWIEDGWVAPLAKGSNNRVYAAAGTYPYNDNGDRVGSFDIKTKGDSVMARFNSNGTIDNGFRVPRSTFSSFTWIQSINEINGKIYITGDFTSADNNYKNIMRLNSSGNVDTTFNGGSLKLTAGFGVYMIRLASGKLLVFGDISKYNSTSVHNIIRITQDGALDTTFSAGGGISGSAKKYRPNAYGESSTTPGGTEIVRSVIENPDGSLFVVGEFTSWDSQEQGYTVMLNSSGTKMPQNNTRSNQTPIRLPPPGGSDDSSV